MSSPEDPKVKPNPAFYDAPTAPINDIAAHWTQVADAISSIAIVNKEIRDALVGTAEAITSLKSELGVAKTVKKVGSPTKRDSRGNLLSDLSEDPQGVAPTILNAASQQEYEHQYNEDIQRRVKRLQIQQTSEFQDRLESYRRMEPSQAIQELKSTKAITDTGINIDGKIASPDQIQEALDKPASSRTSEETNLVDIVNEQFKIKVTDELEKKAPKTIETLLDAVENAGIRQLRYGQLTIQDILRSTGTLAGQATVSLQQGIDEQQAHAQWVVDAAAATASGEEPPPEPTVSRHGLAGFAARHPMGAARIAYGGITGGVAGLAKTLPEIGQGIAIGQIVTKTIENAYSRIYGPIASNIRSGQETGQGLGAGIKAQFQAFGLGMNPFDLTSMGDAAKIVAATRGQGFTGQQADQMEEGIRDVVNNLGISIDQAANYFTDAMRKGGLSVDQVRKQMDTFHDETRQLNMTIDQYTQTILQSNESLRTSGAGEAAPTISQAILRSLPVGYRNQEGVSNLQQLFQQNRGAIVARLNMNGVNANIIDVSAARYAPAAFGQLQQMMTQQEQVARIGWMAANPGKTPTDNDLANWMSQTSAQFKGADVGWLTAQLKRNRAGSGIGNQFSLTHASHILSSQLASVRGRQDLTPEQMSAAQLKESGLVFAPAHARSNVNVWWKNGKQVKSSDTFNVQRDLSDVPMAQLEAARMAAINSLGTPGPNAAITKSQREELMKHLGDRDYDFQKELRKIGDEHTREISDAQVQNNGVTISLKGKAAQDLFKLNNERTTAVLNGTIPANTSSKSGVRSVAP